MTARAATWFDGSWFGDETPRDFARWALAGALVAMVHAALLGSYLFWRTPDEVIGDFNAQMASNDAGGRALLEMGNSKEITRISEVVEGQHGLLQRGLGVIAMSLEQVDVVGPQTPERRVGRLDDVLAGEPAVVRVGAGGLCHPARRFR